MKFAIVKGKKQEALISGERGTCIYCGAETVAHCGQHKVNHWQHKNLPECDTWYEPETEWHRYWKNQFPESFQEVVKFDPVTGEKHIADIHHPTKDVTIEFQHSNISSNEIQSRELFYKNLVWVLDYTEKAENIIIYTDLLMTYEKEIWPQWVKKENKKILHLKETQNSDIYNQYVLNRQDGIQLEQIKKELVELSKRGGYKLIQWKRKPKAWGDAKCPIFLDLGKGMIIQVLKNIITWDGLLVRIHSKEQFISNFLNCAQ
jgi:competence CoiA-like predicted nuclease